MRAKLLVALGLTTGVVVVMAGAYFGLRRASAPATPSAPVVAAPPVAPAPVRPEAPNPGATPGTVAAAAPARPADAAPTPPAPIAPPPIALAPAAPKSAPAAPIAAAPAQPAAAPAPPEFDIVRVERSGDAVVAGRAAPKTRVALVAAGKALAETETDASGQFVLLPPPLPPGEHLLALETRRPEGDPVASRQSVSVLVPKSAGGEVVVALTQPDQPTRILSDAAPRPAPQPAPAAAKSEPAEPRSVAEPKSLAETKAVAEPKSVAETKSVAEPRAVAEIKSGAEPKAVAAPKPVADAADGTAGRAAVTVVAAPPAPALAPQPVSAAPKPSAALVAAAKPAVGAAAAQPQVIVRTVEAEEGGSFYASGLGAPGAPVRIYLNGSFLAEAPPAPDGKWSIRVERGMAPGAYQVRADQTEAGSGKVVSRAEVAFAWPGGRASDAPSPAAPRVALAPAAAPETKPTPAPETKPAPPAASVSPPPAVSAPVAVAASAQPAPTGATETSPAPPASIAAPVERAKAAPPPAPAPTVAQSTAAATQAADPKTPPSPPPSPIVTRTDALASAMAAPAAASARTTPTPTPIASPPVAADPGPARRQQPAPALPTAAAEAAKVAAAAPPARPEATVTVPEIRTATVTRGDSLWRISRKIYGRGVRYTTIYEANQDQIRNPDLIFPGQIFVAPQAD